MGNLGSFMFGAVTGVVALGVVAWLVSEADKEDTLEESGERGE